MEQRRVYDLCEDKSKCPGRASRHVTKGTRADAEDGHKDAIMTGGLATADRVILITRQSSSAAQGLMMGHSTSGSLAESRE